MEKSKKNKRKILAFTGIRSEYDLQYSIAKELLKKENVDFGFVVFGAHLSNNFGNTISNIEEDRFPVIAKILTLFDSDSKYAKAKSAAILMNSLCDVFENHKPDLIVVVGDREETIVASMVATYMNIAIAHVFGGDATFPEDLGNVDEQIRHATTKLAHIHFPSHPEHGKRIALMGEEPWRIYCAGSPALDKFHLYANTTLEVVNDYFGTCIKEKEYAIVIHHSLPNNIEESYREMLNILNSLKERDIKTFISYPNNDPGNTVIIDLIEEFAKLNPQFVLYKNLSRNIFIPLIRHSGLLIGNSSMGLMECPLLEVGAVNVGKRQQQRLNAGNVIFCDFDKESIGAAIDTVLTNEEFKSNLSKVKSFYGDGYSGKRIADILANIDIGNRLLAKKITY